MFSKRHMFSRCLYIQGMFYSCSSFVWKTHLRGQLSDSNAFIHVSAHASVRYDRCSRYVHTLQSLNLSEGKQTMRISCKNEIIWHEIIVGVPREIPLNSKSAWFFSEKRRKYTFREIQCSIRVAKSVFCVNKWYEFVNLKDKHCTTCISQRVKTACWDSNASLAEWKSHCRLFWDWLVALSETFKRGSM